MNAMRLSAICAVTSALLIALAGVGCGGGKKTGPTTPNGNGDTGSGSGSGSGSDDTGDTGDTGTGESAGARIVAMVGEISAKVTGADCNEFASALANWTNRHRAEFEKLVAEVQAAAESGEPDDAEQMDEKIVEGYLIVVEAAAECGDNDSAMAAYDAFNTTVEKATY